MRLAWQADRCSIGVQGGRALETGKVNTTTSQVHVHLQQAYKGTGAQLGCKAGGGRAETGKVGNTCNKYKVHKYKVHTARVQGKRYKQQNKAGRDG